MGKTMSTEKSNKKKVTAIVIGAGNRGYGYANYVREAPEDFQVVAVADPRPFYRDRVKKLCNVPDERAFDDWKQVAELDKFADCVIICTQDQLHKEPAIAFARKGYSILLEKPMAVTEEDCREIVADCKKNNVLLTVCHVLRYTPWVQKLKEIIDQGGIGDVVNIQHLEPPAKAASRCLDCPTEVESACPYSAQKVYLDGVKMGKKGWPLNVITETPDIESVTEALRTGPYGRCVYDMDNDVMSQQTVNMQFTGGATATMSMIAFTKDICNRKVRIFGTKGELTYEDGYGDVSHCDFTTGQTFRHPLPSKHAGSLTGHGGADYYLFKSFVDTLKEGDKSKILTGGEEALASHLLAFAAEKARKENRVVTIGPDLQFT